MICLCSTARLPHIPTSWSWSVALPFFLVVWTPALATVATNRIYDMAFTGQTPDALEFSMASAPVRDKVVLGF